MGYSTRVLRLTSCFAITVLGFFGGSAAGQIVPTRICTSGFSGARGVAISGSFAYVAQDGLSVYDISNPASPVLKAITNTFTSSVLGIVVSGNYAYLACREDGLKIYDVSNPEHPINVGNMNNGGLAAKIAISGDFAYLANEDDGLRIYNISDPSNPINVGHVTTYTGGNEYCQQVAISEHHAYVANTSDGFRVYNVADPSSPIPVGYITNGATGVAITGNWAYVRSSGVEIYNISDPTNLVRVAQIPFWGEWVTVSGKYLFIGGGVDGVQVHDVTNPSSPVLVSQFGGYGGLFSYDMAVSGNYLFFAGSGLIVYATLPIVKLAPVGSNFIKVAWPAPSTGYRLQINPQLPFTNWFTITNTPSQFGGENYFYFSKDAPELFFRLVFQ
jgi:hypothetical protein